MHYSVAKQARAKRRHCGRRNDAWLHLKRPDRVHVGAPRADAASRHGAGYDRFAASFNRFKILRAVVESDRLPGAIGVDPLSTPRCQMSADSRRFFKEGHLRTGALQARGTRRTSQTRSNDRYLGRTSVEGHDGYSFKSMPHGRFARAGTHARRHRKRR